MYKSRIFKSEKNTGFTFNKKALCKIPVGCYDVLKRKKKNPGKPWNS
jgi:hypothetical protein